MIILVRGRGTTLSESEQSANNNAREEVEPPQSNLGAGRSAAQDVNCLTCTPVSHPLPTSLVFPPCPFWTKSGDGSVPDLAE